jgi:hypothetical protein
LSFRKKDAFFVFRCFGLIVLVSVLTYTIIQLFKVPNNIWYYSAFMFAAAGIIGAIKYKKEKTFDFIYLKKEDVDWKSLMKLLPLFLFIWTVSLAYYRGNLSLPRYTSIDAPLHFLNIRLITESLDRLSDAVFASYFTFQKLFLYKSIETGIVLKNFQIYNIALYSFLSLYFWYLIRKTFEIKNIILSLSAFLLITLGFFFNLFITGFLTQSIGFFMLLFFLDLYPQISKNWGGKFVLALIAYTILLCYIFWIPVLALTLAFGWLNIFLKSKNKKRYLLYLIPLLLAGGFIVFQYRSLMNVAIDEGETYRPFVSNFLLFTPFFAYGLYLSYRKWRADNDLVTNWIFASLLFSLLLFVAYASGYASSYTFAKSFYLIGPIIYFLSFYSIGFFLQKRKLPLSVPISAAILALVLAPIVLPLAAAYATPVNLENIQTLEAKLDYSQSKKSMFDIRLKPMDIFYFNTQIAVKLDFNLMETFPYWSEDKIKFLNGLEKHLPKEYADKYGYDHNVNRALTQMMIVSDFKSSKWFVSLTGIWNIAAADPAVLADKVFDLDQWKANHENPYLIILDGQTANKWLWLNQDKFKMRDFKVLYKQGNNYFLKLKENK